MSDTEIETMPMQVQRGYGGKPARVPKVVALAAYEVYCHVHRPQPALVEGNCRGGFGAGELIAFLYARSFPKQEWKTRVDEALRGLRT